MYVAPSQNFIFADTSGNIGYQMPGQIPVRVRGHTGMYPVPGNGTYDWPGFIPFTALPRVYNPPKGYVVSANNRVTMPAPAYNYTITRDWDSGSDGYRAKRITQMILSKTKCSFSDVQTIQNDYHSLLCADFLPLIARLTPQTTEGQAWQRALLAWNCNTAPSNGGGDEDTRAVTATQFAMWYTDMSTLAAAETNASGGHYENAVYLMNALNATADTPADRNCLLHLSSSALAAAVASASGSTAIPACLQWASGRLDSIATAQGGDDGTDGVSAWGNGVHHAYMQHPVLSGSPVGCISDRSVTHGGDPSTVNVGGYQMDASKDHGAFTQTSTLR